MPAVPVNFGLPVRAKVASNCWACFGPDLDMDGRAVASLNMLSFAAGQPGYADTPMSHLVPTVIEQAKRGHFAFLASADRFGQAAQMHGFCIWARCNDAELKEWKATNGRAGHSGHGPHLIFLRFTAHKGLVLPFARALADFFPDTTAWMRRSKERRFVRSGRFVQAPNEEAA